METNTNDKIEFKDKLIYFFNRNKVKFYILILFLILLSISSIFFQNNIEKKNQITADNYIKAGLYLASGKKEESLNIFDNIIKSGNKFYSILALSTILEKNLISDQKIILDYFLIVEKNIKSKDQKELILFKKALFLLKNNNTLEAEKLYQKLKDNNSKLKFLADEVFIK